MHHCNILILLPLNAVKCYVESILFPLCALLLFWVEEK